MYVFKIETLLILFIPLLLINYKRNENHYLFDKQEFELEVADSLSFRPNNSEGWGTLQTYINPMLDSIELELILSRNTTAQNDWHKPSNIGILVSKYKPKGSIAIEFKEPNRQWQIHILNTGDVFLKLIGGPIPDGNPVIIPVKFKFKK